ncbi:hypothetical protein U1Q18_017089 [Sarracenia purpurea var. burkii]
MAMDAGLCVHWGGNHGRSKIFLEIFKKVYFGSAHSNRSAEVVENNGKLPQEEEHDFNDSCFSNSSSNSLVDLSDEDICPPEENFIRGNAKAYVKYTQKEEHEGSQTNVGEEGQTLSLQVPQSKSILIKLFQLNNM